MHLRIRLCLTSLSCIIFMLCLWFYVNRYDCYDLSGQLVVYLSCLFSVVCLGLCLVQWPELKRTLLDSFKGRGGADAALISNIVAHVSN
jgi:hypothetical protein